MDGARQLRVRYADAGMSTHEERRCREVWLVRHGETAANRARIIQGQTDTALHERGRAQARALAAWLAAVHRASPFAAVVASPLSRAAETASLAAAALGLPVTHDPGFMERSFGELEGHPAEEAYRRQDEAGGDPFHYRPPRGESTWDLAHRVWAAFDALVERDDVGERVLLVSHGGPIGALVSRALGVPYTREGLSRFRRDNTGITALGRKSAAHAWTVHSLNARPHLVGPAVDEVGPVAPRR